MKPWKWIKSPQSGLVGAYTAVASLQIIALVVPESTAYDRGFGYPLLATLISICFLVGALASLAGQFVQKIPFEYMGLPMLSAGYGTFGLAAIFAALVNPTIGLFVYGLGYTSVGCLFHARWRTKADEFRDLQRKQADEAVARLRQQARSRVRDDTSVD